MECQQKLELTGLARTRRLRFQLRILLKNPVCRCHAKRRVMGATVGMYGDLQGIAELEFPLGKSDDAMPKQLTIK